MNSSDEDDSDYIEEIMARVRADRNGIYCEPCDLTSSKSVEVETVCEDGESKSNVSNSSTGSSADFWKNAKNTAKQARRRNQLVDRAFKEDVEMCEKSEETQAQLSSLARLTIPEEVNSLGDPNAPIIFSRNARTKPTIHIGPTVRKRKRPTEKPTRVPKSASILSTAACEATMDNLIENNCKCGRSCATKFNAEKIQTFRAEFWTKSAKVTIIPNVNPNEKK